MAFSFKIRPICLPDNLCDPASDTNRTSDEFDSCRNGRDKIQATGWGETEEHQLAESLKKISLDLLSRANCSKIIDLASNPTSQLCAHVPNQTDQDSCGGDSGSPLMCYKGGRAYALGLVSSRSAQPCGQFNVPGVYSRVCAAMPWIRETIAEDVSWFP